MAFHGPAVDTPGSTSCAQCGTEADPDARFCTECSASLPGTPAPVTQVKGRSYLCPSCAEGNYRDSKFCAQCGGQMYDSAPQVSSSGRRDLSSPRVRTAMLAADRAGKITEFMGGAPAGAVADGGDLFSRIAAAERIAAEADARVEAARIARQLAVANAPEGTVETWDPETRQMVRAWRSPVDLPADERAAFVEADAAIRAHEEAMRAADAGRSQRSRLLGAYDRAYGDMGSMRAVGDDDAPLRYR